MATDIGSPQRFFHMPRFQHQAPRQVFYKRPDFAQQQAMQQLTFDGKRMRKAVNRKTIDYNPSVIRYLENRLWQRDHRDLRAIQPDAGFYNDLVPPLGMLNNPMNAVTTKFVRTSTNKVKCPVFVIRWTPEGRRLVTGASSGEFTLWNGLTFNFETILQAHDSPVRAMTWSHNDMWMLTADHGGFVKYWQSNMNNVKMFQAHKEAIREASFSPTDNKFATCSDDGTVRIWDFLRCHEERILRGHGADVKCVDWHPTKGLVVSGSKDSQQPIKFWDPKTGQSLATLHAHKNTVMEVKWNLNGNWLLTASRDHLCKLFDIRNLKEELQIFRGHKKEATAVAWHPVHEGLFASGGSDGSLLFWHTGVEKEVGGMEMAHEGMIWSLAWHPLGHILCSGSNDHTSKFWTRNRPGDKMRDRYNLNLLPGMSEDGMEYDDLEPNSLAAIPGMGIPEQLKAVMEQEQNSKEAAPEVEMSIPGLDWGMDEVMGRDAKKVPQKKVPYAKPIPAQFQQAWAENKVPMMQPSGDMSKDRKVEQKVEGKKKSQAEIEQEMAALQYTNPLLLEQIKMNQMNTDSNMGPPQGPPFPSSGGPGGPGGPMPPNQQGFPLNMPPQQIPNNMGPHMGPGGMPGPFIPPGQMGPSSGPQPHQLPPQGMMGPPDMQGPQGMQRHPGPPRHMGPDGLHSMGHGPRGMQGPLGGMMGPPLRGMGPRDPQGPPPQGGIISPQGNMMAPQGPMQGGMMGPPSRTHNNISNNYGMGSMHGPSGNIQGPPGNMQGPHENMQSYMQNQGQNSGPMLHGMGQQGPNMKGDPRGPPHTYHMGPVDRQGLGGSGGPDQGYWDDTQPGRRAPQDFDGSQDFHGRGEENWRPGPGPGFQGGAGPRGRGHRGGGSGGNWGHDERFGGGDFRGRRDDRFRAGGPGRPGARGFPDEYGIPDEVFDGPEDMSRGWDSGGRGRLPRSGGPPRGGGHELYRDTQQMHDGSSPAGRERSSSLQGMDMASLPPRKRPWQDGPGTGDPRDLESPGPDGGRPPQRDDGGFVPPIRGGRGGWGPGPPGPRRGGPPPRGAPRGVRGR
ncbi:pre-mRNA 3' end processing protein WDR33 [Cynoglossus semilaevis]|uniref:pre-mRNA 3' end processing protein WDR33 n=1 Tax=Cynoglossus semilaevis TaxID=244447 RepID=A0A3P8WEY7_CYNSE|nr:pre-mRNA 3' end processing protein WDR33 [Cynoglossus semilaevis]XP_008335664.1 pre-mRNA 3' end processing protein WDR33 [Cynoglossus semilaevis]XP_024909532.1 pre-mRNA 3' end processing protein WDR33 [Cynoglossus semilaevis]